MTAIIIDLNGNIIAPEHWSDTFLHKDDDLEIIQIIGGG
jgi:thiamine biosynthesis protein ThiS